MSYPTGYAAFYEAAAPPSNRDDRRSRCGTSPQRFHSSIRSWMLFSVGRSLYSRQSPSTVSFR